jgi:glutamate-1-semialdehyde 2,1-aminomutase
MVTTTSAPHDIESRYERNFSSSKRAYERANAVFIDGVTHDSRRLTPFPIYIDRAEGSRKWDLDGNEIIDYVCGHGALLLGHNHPAVVEATRKQLERGTHYGAGHEAEVRWGEMVLKLVPSAEAVRFTSSGTEATLLALRIARAATGKSKVIKFLGHFHGWQDYVIRGLGGSNYQIPGVPDGVDETVAVLPADIMSVSQYLAENRDVAAVIIEPNGASWGTVMLPPDFLHDLRRITSQEGVLLIMDEVITGFRWSPGGAQQVKEIRPDLTTMAKILAGGLPGGAVAGRRDLLATLEYARAKDQKKIPHQGTFNANPLSATAGATCLELVADGEAQRKADMAGRELRERMNDTFQELELPGFVYGESSVFHVFLGPGGPGDVESVESGGGDHAALLNGPFTPVSTAFQQSMLLEGVHLFNMGGLASAVHSEEDINQTVEAFRKSLVAVEPLLTG